MRGPGKHQKRLSAPSHWLLDKLSGSYAPKASPGPHKLRDCMPLLGSIDRNASQLSAMSIAVRGIEGEADDLLDRGLRALFNGDTSPGHKLTVERVYDLIEAVVDRCEDIMDVVDGIVVEQV